MTAPFAADGHAPLIVQESSGIERTDEPVTLGVPFPKGLLYQASRLRLGDPRSSALPLQVQPLAHWSDGSLKWILLDFQVSVGAHETRELSLTWPEQAEAPKAKELVEATELADHFHIHTGACSFAVPKDILSPLSSAWADEGQEILDPALTRTVLLDIEGMPHRPFIQRAIIETEGTLRTTLYLEGFFKSQEFKPFANFSTRLTFYAGKPTVKIDFTVVNPKAARHPGGLWDLGDPGSVLFKDLALHFGLSGGPDLSLAWRSEPGGPMQTAGHQDFSLYQDSSGGLQWQSSNHVNRNGEVRTSFRGYRATSNGEIVKEGFRAEPVVCLSGPNGSISAVLQHFWQNFPKAMECKDSAFSVQLFPQQYNDWFELQGGEQKTHTLFLDFSPPRPMRETLGWAHAPLILRCTPRWIAGSGVLPHRIPTEEDPHKEYLQWVATAVEGQESFFERREIIDEYGWRNFGELYADHEAAGQHTHGAIVSHYNNQYDCIFGMLAQWAMSGDARWFTLADDLCAHVRDIDIYHTDEDRPEYNRGLFWHTEHYIDAGTATHRCFSREHLPFRQGAYGGGPSLSHNYSSGLLLHYYMTGNPASRQAFQELVRFVENNVDAESTICSHAINRLKRLKESMALRRSGSGLVQLNKVYGLDGPGRASGNALNTLVDAFIHTGQENILVKVELLIRRVIHPDDDIDRRDLLDTENRWMYVVFLQALGKYLDVKAERNDFDDMFAYGRESLLHYARWILHNERPYLEHPEKLEYPNETWAAQELRKCNVLLYASRHAEPYLRGEFLQKAKFFYDAATKQLDRFATKTLTRPIALLLLNGGMLGAFRQESVHAAMPASVQTLRPSSGADPLKSPATTRPYRRIKSTAVFSLRKEWCFLKARIFRRRFPN